MTGTGASVDAVNPEANTVVKLVASDNTTCSGTLISPSVVVTALHCILGDDYKGAANRQQWAIGVYDQSGILQFRYAARETRTIEDHPDHPEGEKGSDVALIYMCPSRAPAPNNPTLNTLSCNPSGPLLGYELKDAYAYQPTLSFPPGTPLQNSDVVRFAYPIGMAGFSSTSVRTVGGPTNPILLDPTIDSNQNRYWSPLNGDWSSQPGDSGGPLFVRLPAPDGSGNYFRNVLGVTHGIPFTGNPTFFTDITYTGGQSPHDWIIQNMEDDTPVGVLKPHGTAWRLRHGFLDGTFWRGKVDYIGACEPDDQDCDHWIDSHDDCPYVYNPDQTESLPDGIGDACRDCPCSHDVDHDGVCGACDPSASSMCQQECSDPSRNGKYRYPDNCPNVANSLQVDCNYLAEQANSPTQVWGDRCDPVPCPGSFGTSHIATTNCVPQGSPYPPDTKVCTGQRITDDVTTQTVPSFPANGTTVNPLPAGTQPAIPELVGVGQTSARYCQGTSLGSANCKDPSVVQDAQLSFWSTADAEQNDLQHPWHRVTFGGARDHVFPDWVYGSTVSTSTWDFQADLGYWLQTSPNAPAIPVCTLVNGSPDPGCLDGVFWMHGATDVGSDSLHQTAGGVTVGFHGLNVANNYIDLKASTGISWCPIPSPIVVAGNGQSGLGGPGKALVPKGWLVLPPGTGNFQIRSREDTEVLVPSSALSTMGALQDDGTFISTANLPNGAGAELPCTQSTGHPLDSTVASIGLDPMKTWLGAIEVSRAGQTAYDAAAVSTDGTEVLGLLSGGDVVAPPPACSPTAGTGCGDGASPGARTDFVAAFSRVLGGVLLAGGRAGGALQHDVWLHTLDGVWSDITPRADLGTRCALCFGAVKPYGEILAATYSYADDHLWVVDKLRDGWFTRIRLSRATFGGGIEELAEFPAIGAYDEYWLTLDRDGGILVTLARSKKHGFATGRLDLDGEGRVHVTALHKSGAERLLAAPIASASSYAFVVEQAGQVRVDRLASLDKHGPCDLDESL